MTEWCRGINLAHVAWVKPKFDAGAERFKNMEYEMIAADGTLIATVKLDDEEYLYFFPRALIPPPPGTELVRITFEMNEILCCHEAVVALVLSDDAFTEGARPICADGLAWLGSVEEEMIVWRFPGGRAMARDRRL